MHPLDRPVWSALTSRQASFAVGGGAALRFPADVSPLAAGADAAVVAALIPAGDDVSLLEAAPPTAPAGVTVIRSALCVQMIAPCLAGGGANVRLEPLNDADAAEMLALATLTRPGPFRARTHALGRFLGIRHGARLVAMAGERLNLDGFHEVSAVCTHPDYRGRGYGAALMRAVAQRMLDQGDTPFLHSYADNAPAIALYRSLGFDVRAEIIHAVWANA
ncbi:MAG TPA: GNAT family N-acetyltransferase [Caulobacterales bacterium]|nr:GNAT family N-acetyltransferase [Caulobacterales bacterium]